MSEVTELLGALSVPICRRGVGDLSQGYRRDQQGNVRVGGVVHDDVEMITMVQVPIVVFPDAKLLPALGSIAIERRVVTIAVSAKIENARPRPTRAPIRRVQTVLQAMIVRLVTLTPERGNLENVLAQM